MVSVAFCTSGSAKSMSTPPPSSRPSTVLSGASVVTEDAEDAFVSAAEAFSASPSLHEVELALLAKFTSAAFSSSSSSSSSSPSSSSFSSSSSSSSSSSTSSSSSSSSSSEMRKCTDDPSEGVRDESSSCDSVLCRFAINSLWRRTRAW